MTYLMTYDLKRPGQNYPDLLAALRRSGAEQILYSTWLENTNESASQLRDRYIQFIDANDRIFVCGADHWAYRNIMNREAADRILPR